MKSGRIKSLWLYFLVIFSLTHFKLKAQSSDSLYNGIKIIQLIQNNHSSVPDPRQIANTLTQQKRNLDFYNVLFNITEPSTISWLGTDYTFEVNKSDQKKPFTLDADVKVPLALGGKFWDMFTIHIVPELRVRQFQNDPRFNDLSYPVRTPSYIPQGILYVSPSPDWWKRDSSGLRGKYIGFKLFHNSNGQDGSDFFKTGPQSGDVNTYNGNFSELAVFELSFGFVKEYYKTCSESDYILHAHQKTNVDQCIKPVSPNRLFYTKIGYEYHPAQLTDEGFLKFHLYGLDRINLQAGYILMPTFRNLILGADAKEYYSNTPPRATETWRYVLNFTYIADLQYNQGNISHPVKVPLFDAARRMNLNVTVYRRLQDIKNFSVFAQAGYYGSDDYNIYFQQSLWQVRGGVAFELSR